MRIANELRSQIVLGVRSRMPSSCSINLPCVVSARALPTLSFAPTLVRLGSRQVLVWASQEDLILDQQPPSDELTGMLQGKIVREEPDLIVVAVRSRGIEKKLELDRVVLVSNGSSIFVAGSA